MDVAGGAVASYRPQRHASRETRSATIVWQLALVQMSGPPAVYVENMTTQPTGSRLNGRSGYAQEINGSELPMCRMMRAGASGQITFS